MSTGVNVEVGLGVLAEGANMPEHEVKNKDATIRSVERQEVCVFIFCSLLHIPKL